MKVYKFLLLFLLLLMGCGSPTAVTPVQIITQTAVFPSATVSQATSLPPSPAFTPDIADATPTLVAVSTATAEQLLPPQVSPTAEIPPVAQCGTLPGWVRYSIQPGDTLFSLGNRTGTTVAQIQQANCLTGIIIYAGQVLYLPFLPPTSTVLPTYTPTIPSATPTVTLPPPTLTFTPSPTAEQLPPPGPGDPTLKVEPASGPVGTIHTIYFTDYKPNEIVTIDIVALATQQIITTSIVTADGSGNGQWQFATTTVYTPGFYGVRAQGDQGSHATGSLEVTP